VAVPAGSAGVGSCLQNWQTKKNGLFSRVGQPIYVFRLLECLGSPEEYCIAILVPRLFHLILKECRATPLRITPSPSRPPAKFRDGRWRFAGRRPDSLLRPTCRVLGQTISASAASHCGAPFQIGSALQPVRVWIPQLIVSNLDPRRPVAAFCTRHSPDVSFPIFEKCSSANSSSFRLLAV